MKKTILIVIMVFLLTGHVVSSDLAESFKIGINYNGYYSDNIFFNASRVQDYVSQFQADINYSTQTLNVYLDASAGIYTQNPGFNSFQIEPGVEFLYFFKGRSSLYLDLGYSILNYKELYRDFNYSGPRFQMGVKLYLSPQTLFKAGYLFHSRRYENYRSFDFMNHTAFMELNRFFNTQTTVRMQAGFNFRYYPHIANEFDSESAPGSHSMGVPNVYGLLRISQGLGTKLGITGETEVRKNFRGLEDADTSIKNAYIIYPYNDNYLWDGVRVTLIVKKVLRGEFAIEGLFSYFNKNYPGVYVMDAEGNIVQPLIDRQDSLWLFNAKISKRFRKLDAFASLSYRDNRSNDDYFFYKMVSISAGIGYYF